MKKLCFAVVTMVTMLLGMTGCTTETSDVIVYCRTYFGASSGTLVEETEGLNETELKKVFDAHLLQLGESFGEDVIIRRQNDETKVKNAVIQAAKDADAEIKEKYGNPVKVQDRFSKLGIRVYYIIGDKEDVTVADYTYKE